jgi:hypothetical protein
MICLIYCKNFCKCHNVPPPQQSKKLKKEKRLKIAVVWVGLVCPPKVHVFVAWSQCGSIDGTGTFKGQIRERAWVAGWGSRGHHL